MFVVTNSVSVLAVSLFLLIPAVCYGQDRIRLQDLPVLTLYPGHFTAARRSRAVPQIQCMGGSAGCSAYIPPVVQCYNRGFDGYDVQWECKADMDNAYRFGQIAINCEGYDYPDDPYVLRGSCGLEYHLELTKEGYQHHYPNQKSSNSYQHNHHNDKGVASVFVSMIIFVIGAIVVGSVVYMCWYNPHHDAPPPYPGPSGYGYTERPSATAPPPPGYGSDYTSFSSGSANWSGQPGPGCDYSTSHRSPNTGAAGGGGGFWTGAAAGGVLGYLFGSRGSGRTAHHASYSSPPQPSNSWWSSTSDSQWSRPSSSSSGFASSSGDSTGTRTSSGFGGTKRR